MKKRLFLTYFVFSICHLQAATINWIAPNPNNDMEDTNNWNPNTVPGTADIAVFNSATSGVSTNPTESTAAFTVSSFNFPTLASPFIFTFNNQNLAFSGLGITGTETDTTLNFTNTNNTTTLADIISFASVGTTGGAIISVSNNASITGAQSGQYPGIIGSSIHSVGAFSISNDGSITVNNIGIDSATASGGNSIAIATSGQLKFDDSFTANNDVTVSIENSGTFTGSNSTSPDLVAVIQGNQFNSVGAFTTGNDFSLEVQNSGNNSNTGIGGSQIGVINAPQIGLQGTAILGNDASITITNTGVNSSSNTVNSDQIAYLNDNQLFVGEPFQVGERFHLTVSNTGTDNSNGVGQNQVCLINSNSGTSGDQVLLLQGGSFGPNAAITVTSSGTCTGTNTNGGSLVAGMNLGQFTVGDTTSIGSYNYNAEDHFTLTISNTGNDSAVGIGGDAVGTVSTNQAAFLTPTSLGHHAQITISNQGNYSGSASATLVNIGSTGSHQFLADSTFQTGDDFTLHVTNAGTNTGSGVGNYYIGDVITGQQADFEHGLTVGNNASIVITNSGSNSSSTTFQNQVGSMMGYAIQFLVKEGFQAGDDLQLTLTNSGYDNSTNAGGNFVGFFNNNLGSFSASQMHLENGGTLGNNAAITITNTGTFEGNNFGSNAIASLAGGQFVSLTAFEAGNQFSLNVSMHGTSNGSGQNNNSIALLGGSGSSQVHFGGNCTVGNGASFAISNSGINNDASGTNNFIGYLTDSQMKIVGDFNAGNDLNIQISNSGINAGDSSNFAGYITNSQLSFGQQCTIGDGSTISVANSGTVGASQILFSQGFNVTNGKATIQALNTGVVTNYGIDIQGNSEGGNAEIILGNNTINIATTAPTFTIGGLSGDANSIAQSEPILIIHRDSSSQSNFSGVIQDFSGSAPTSIVKTGSGVQILSGRNNYTGLTTIREGTLIVSGSLTGDALIEATGRLKGSGLILGTFTNAGTIAPGQSIGTLLVGNYVNNGGTYEVEVNGAGQSDLIHSLGTATINGGTVVVSSVDNSYLLNTPYTIVTADLSLTGTFTNATSADLITPTLSYDENNVFLTINSALIRAAGSCNQVGVATNLDGITTLTEEQSLVIGTLIGLPEANIQQVLESLSGFQYTNETWTTEIATTRFIRRLYDPLREQVTSCGQLSCTEGTAWIETGANVTNLHGSHALSGDMYSYQITGGVQKQILEDVFLGLAASYEHDHEKFWNAKANRNVGYIGLYGLYRPHGFYILADLAEGYSASHLSRSIEVANLNYKASGHPDVNTLAFYTEVGLDMGLQGFLLQPFAGIQVEKNWRRKFTERSSSGWGLTIDERQWASVFSRLGIHLSTCNPCQCVDISLDVAWDQRLTGNGNSTDGSFNQFGDSYDICGTRLDDASIDCALTVTKDFGQALQLYLEIEGQWWKHADTYGILGGLKYSW